MKIFTKLTQAEKDLRKAKRKRYNELHAKYNQPEWFANTSNKSDNIFILLLIVGGFLIFIMGMISYPGQTINDIKNSLSAELFGLTLFFAGLLFRIIDLLLHLKYWLIIEPNEHPREIVLEKEEST